MKPVETHPAVYAVLKAHDSASTALHLAVMTAVEIERLADMTGIECGHAATDLMAGLTAVIREAQSHIREAHTAMASVGFRESEA